MEYQQNDQGQLDSPPQHVPSFGRPKPRSSKKTWLVIGVIAAVVLLGGGVAYWLLAGKKDQPKQQTTNTQQQTQSTQQSTMPAEQATVPKTFKSTKLNVEFTYRSDWAVKENTDKTEVIVTSPQVTYTKKDGVSTQGVFTIKMRNGLLPDGMKASIQNAVAAKDSEVIAYAAPATEQRKYTNLSFGGNGPNMVFFMVTGSVGFKSGEAFGSAIDTQGDVYLFAGGYGTDPQDTLAFEPVPKSAFSSEVFKQAQTLIESLKVY